MSWLTVTYRPGFQEELTSWRMQIKSDGRLWQKVDIRRFSPPEQATHEHRGRLANEELAKLRLLVSALDFEAVERTAREQVVDDAEEVSFEVHEEGAARRFWGHPEWWDFQAQRGELTRPELHGALALWRAVLRCSPYHEK